MARYFIRDSKVRLTALAGKVRSLENAYQSRTDAQVTIADLEGAQAEQLLNEGVQLIPSTRYELLPGRNVLTPIPNHPQNMRDVMIHNGAVAAWPQTRGAGVHIAIVDTGICGTMPEFSGAKQSRFRWAISGDDPWTDVDGHGSMTAACAAATSAFGGRYDGVAPDASVIACKTSTFDDTELFQIYEYLGQLVDTGQIDRLVISNSYGTYACAPPSVRPTDPFPDLIRRTVAKGIVVVFAAGNNHVNVCRNDPANCEPNTIWGPNSLDEVLTVGTVDANNRMDQPPVAGPYSHRDSSRGPGQFASLTVKPDCVAPTYGEVVWGCGYQAMEWWGTSGAAPQVAGLAALILSIRPNLSPSEVRDLIRRTCIELPLGPTCAGAGLINCQSAVTAALNFAKRR